LESEHHWIVSLPPGVRRPFTVFVNGVRQREGVDYTINGTQLRFGRELRKEPPVGFWRWFIGAFGIGTYRRNDQVDVTWEVDGAPRMVHALDILPPGGTDEPA
jgi:hypothetical protein